MARAGTWLKYGSLGCLGAGAFALVAMLVASAAALLIARPAQVEDRVFQPVLPVEGSRDFGNPGRVLVEVREADLRIERVEPGEPLRVEARYDVNAFALEGELDPSADGSAAWTYRVSFGRGEGAGPFAGLVSLARRSPARIGLYLPDDVPLDLSLKMEEGRAVVRLGGLWLSAADVYLGSGALDLNVNQPVRQPMERLSICTENGGALLNGLGNASPRRLDVSFRLGQIDMDLGGRWLTDADIDISGEMGGGVVHLPADVILEGLDLDGIEVPAAPETDSPTLRFSIYTAMGWLELSDIHLRGADLETITPVAPPPPVQTPDGG